MVGTRLSSRQHMPVLDAVPVHAYRDPIEPWGIAGHKVKAIHRVIQKTVQRWQRYSAVVSSKGLLSNQLKDALQKKEEADETKPKPQNPVRPGFPVCAPHTRLEPTRSSIVECEFIPK